MTSSSSQNPCSIGPSRGAQALALLAALLFVACSSYKNHGEREQAANEKRDEAERLDAGPADACIRTCTPDPGSNPVDCDRAERDLEFMNPPLLDFEGDTSGYVYYGYTDGSAPPVTRDYKSFERCGKTTQVAHIAGGPFIGWGGGVGLSIRNFWDHATNTPCGSPGQETACESPDVDASQVGKTIDVSHWDGISMWARRGPESQAGFRVSLGDKYTDDDLNIDQDRDLPGNDGIDSEQRYCKRVRECGCPSNRPCNEVPGVDDPNRPGELLQLCWDGRYDSLPVANGGDSSGGANTLLGEKGERFYVCGASACALPYAAGNLSNDIAIPTTATDPEFQGKACSEHAFLNGTNGKYCFNPGEDPEPAESYELCGDHWQTPVRLSTDWQLFLVPFSGMLQQGYGKESPGLHPDQISIFRLTWEGGWIDYYIDDVRFYRVAR